MILEFDAMVGTYMQALDDAGVTDNTVLIVTSDHGDMNMEHQQFYKMVPYDASARVPLVIRLPPGSPAVANAFITTPTSHLDLFPTMMDLALVPASARPSVLQGESLAPFLKPTPAGPRQRPFNAIQFHGCDIAMSWFSIVDGTYKYTVYGTGEQHPPQLFNLLTDPGENTDLSATEPDTVARLDKLIRTVIDYPAVAKDVSAYNHASLAGWVNHTKNWKQIALNGRWKASFDLFPNASIAAIEAYVSAPPQINKCRGNPVWPPKH